MKRSLILALCVASLAPVPVLADLFSYTGSVQQFTAKTAGEYDIVATGASGGGSLIGGGMSGTSGGLGAEIGGEFTLTAGEILDIYVGGTGQGAEVAGGGGGGTFVVVHTSNSPLVIAGGGGGGGEGSNGAAGQTSEVNSGQGGGGDDGGGGGGFNGPNVNGGLGGGGSGFPNLTGMGATFGKRLTATLF